MEEDIDLQGYIDVIARLGKFKGEVSHEKQNNSVIGSDKRFVGSFTANCPAFCTRF